MSDKKTKSKAKSEAKPDVQPTANLDTSKIDQAPMLGTGEEVIGKVSRGGTLSAADKDVPSDTGTAPVGAPGKGDKKPSHKKKVPAPKDETESNSTPPPEPSVLSAEPEPEPAREPLRLPRGGFIALRKSGGLNFATREVVVYPDGRIAYDARGVPQKEYNRLRRALNDGQIIELRKLLDQSNFWRMEGTGKQNPDAFAYEIAARMGQRSNELELFDGSIPESFKPVLERLTKLLPE